MKKKKIDLKDIKSNPKKEHNHDDGHNHSGQSNNYNAYVPAIISFTMLIIGIALDYFDVEFWFLIISL